MARRFSETVNIQPVNTQTGAVQAFSGLADRLTQFSSQLGAKSVQVAQQSSLQEGLESGGAVPLRDEQGQTVKPEFKEKPMFIGGIEVAAHNKALRARYLAELNNDSRTAVSEIMAQYPESVLSFNDAAKGYRDGLMKGVEPSVRGAVAEDLDNMITSARIRVQGADIKRQRKENIEVLSNSGDKSFESANSLVRSGDGLSAGEAMLEGVKSVDAMVEAGYITESQGQIRKDTANREMAEQSFKGAMDAVYEDEGINGVNAWLTENEGNTPGGFSADEWDSVTDQIQADANRKESRKRAGVSKSLKDAQNKLRQYKLAKSLGIEVSEEDETALNMAIAGTGLEVDKSIVDKTAIFSVMSRAQRSEIIEQSTAAQGQLDDVDQHAAILKADQKINELAREDGYSLGVQQGIIEPEPLDLSDPELFTGRTDVAAMLSEHYGVDVSPLSDGEAAALAASFDSMTPSEKVTMAQTLSASPAVWEQLDKKNAGSFAMAAATGDEGVMTAIFNGQELLKAGLVKAPKHEDFNDTFNEYVGNVYGTQDKKAILDAAKSHYAATSASALGGVFDEDDFKSSLEAVTGGVEEIGGSFFGDGSRVELPRGVSGDDFEDYIEVFNPSLVAHFGGVANFTDQEAADAIQEGEIVSVGSNQYGVRVGETTLFTNQGTPFIFSFDADLLIEGKAEAVQRSNRSRGSRRENRGVR